MRALLVIVGVVLITPVLLVIGIAAGPVALLLLALIGTALIVVAIGEAVSWPIRHTRIHG
jgi:hypothetical protein